MKDSFSPSGIRTVSFILAVILAIPALWEGAAGFYSWLSPFMMLNSVFALKTFTLLNIFALPVLILTILHKRWFCKYLCPAGWCFDRVSMLSKRKSTEYRNVPEIGRWIAVFSLAAAIFGLPVFVISDPMAIFNGFFTVFSGRYESSTLLYFSMFPVLLVMHLLLPGIWCKRICPLGGLQTILRETGQKLYRIFAVKEQEIPAGNNGRRYFIMSGAGVIAGMMIPPFLKAGPAQHIRPPASVKSGLFDLICCRCGNCVRACPAKIIFPHTSADSILSWMTPEVNFSSGYCLETCNLCGRVCPTGAISPFSVDEKSRLIMGKAEITINDCYLQNNRECIKCREACKYDAIRFIVTNNLLNVKPVVDISKCTGCGACVAVCPAGCISVSPSEA